MRTKKMLACLAAVLLVWMTALPGFAMAEALQVTDAAKAACKQAGGTLLTQVRTVRAASPYGTQSVVLRSVPSNSYDAVAMLLVGQELTVVGEAGGFCFVLLADGGMGWLASDEVK